MEVSIIYIMQSKSMDWFLYDRDLRYERINIKIFINIQLTSAISPHSPIITPYPVTISDLESPCYPISRIFALSALFG